MRARRGVGVLTALALTVSGCTLVGGEDPPETSGSTSAPVSTPRETTVETFDPPLGGRDWVVVKGNHDRALPNFLRDPRWVDPRAADRKPWTRRDVGAGAALASYGIEDAETRPMDEVHAEALAKVPPDHARWLDGLPIWHLTPRALFVHAGIRPGVDLRAQVEDDLLWLRKPFLDDTSDHGVLVVHGHTPVKKIQHKGNRLDIDTGAAHGGPVSGVRLDEDGVWLLTDKGPKPVAPPKNA